MPKLNVSLESKWPRVVAVTIAQALLSRSEITIMANSAGPHVVDRVTDIVEECLRDALGEEWLKECRGYRGCQE